MSSPESIPSRSFLQRHPIVRDVLLWSIPAVLLALFLRGLLFSYSHYAFWHADSNSYFSFAYRLLTEHAVALYAKRRYAYPILLLPISILPGSPLAWLAFFQHLLGAASVIPLAYVIRRCFSTWKFTIIPVTLLYAGLPVAIWFEHTMLAEGMLASLIPFCFAGWTLWAARIKEGRSRPSDWWWFLIPFALFALMKPSSRFLFPGIVLGLIYVRGWRYLRWPQLWAFAVVIGAALTMGQKEMAARLLYASAFPLTQLDSPANQEYKAEIRDMVTKAHERIDFYYTEDGDPKDFLKNDDADPQHPHWEKLKKNENKSAAVMKQLAIEAIRSDPVAFFRIGLSRLLGAANPDDFSYRMFRLQDQKENLASRYHKATYQGEKGGKLMRFLYGLPDGGDLPFEDLDRQLGNKTDSPQERLLIGYTIGYHDFVRFFPDPTPPGKILKLEELLWPTWLGWLVIAGLALSFLPHYQWSMGVWALVVLGYLFGVHLIGSSYGRFFYLAYPILFTMLAVPVDLLVGRIRAGRAKSPQLPP